MHVYADYLIDEIIVASQGSTRLLEVTNSVPRCLVYHGGKVDTYS